MRDVALREHAHCQTTASALADALSLGRPLRPDEARDIATGGTRIDEPRLVTQLYRGGLLPPESLRAVLARAWMSVEFPELSLRRRDWVTLFRAAAYRPPDGPVTLFRDT